MKYAIYLSILCTVVGCSQGMQITGTVRFDDGSPITQGSVVFNSSTESFFGTITSAGRYTTGGEKIKQGLPDGAYTVWLSGTETSNNTLDDEGNVVSYTVTRPVAAVFTSPSTSPLKFEVKKGGSKTFDVVVERNPALKSDSPP